VYRRSDRNNVVGLLMVKKLIVLNPDERRSLTHIPLRVPLLVHPDAGLLVG
jgi:CBS domain containing-hemolysin-like protein